MISEVEQATVATDPEQEERIVFNGINARTGDYLFPPLSISNVNRTFRNRPEKGRRGLLPGIDPRVLSECGWGVVFHADEDPAVREALAPLLDLRRQQAEELFQEYSGADGYHGEDKEDFLVARYADVGAVNPSRVPYYILLVGDPGKIPFDFQHQLDIQYAVGRVAFDTPEEYARYAASVVAAESGKGGRERRIGFFSPRNPDDVAMELSSTLLVAPLIKRLGLPSKLTASRPWKIEKVLGDKARKHRLAEIYTGPNGPALVFTATHGMGFPLGDSLQRDHQGALLCGDWPGPVQWQQAIGADLYFSADDVQADADVRGKIIFHFACHGVGTPVKLDFREKGERRRKLTRKPFVARLPQRVLAHPRGGALAVIGHVERAWPYSFLDKRDNTQIAAFESALRLLMAGFPVGAAMEGFNQRYAEISADLTRLLWRKAFHQSYSENKIRELWTANNDARNYAVIGDPAVRVSVSQE
ncbi:MAG TPA: hypothetical protein VGS07_18825 [Thermoanaerobaculia bacterium]|jgi:hypothetical protein|nr:hypothetical protein [Thermoanaerobaculia bacterium]